MGNTGGKYSAKSGDLSKSQLKRAGGLKASKKPTIDYTQTSRKIGSGVTRDSSGKLLTGSVKLSNGQIGVYKAGKRVINVKPSSGGGGGGGGGGNSTWKGRGLSKSAVSKAMKMHANDLAKRTPDISRTIKSNNADVEAKRAAAKRRPASGRSTLPTPSTSYADRPSFAKQQAVVAKALIDWKKAKDAGTKAYAKRQYDQAVSVLNGIKDYFR
jgi:hypothetical protein